MSDGTGVVAWPVVVPLLGGILAFLAGRRVMGLAALVSLATAGAAFAAVLRVAERGPYRHEVGGWPVPLGIALRADGIAALALATIAAVGIAVTAYALAYFGRGSRAASRFFALWFLTWAAIFGLVLSADVFNMYVALELSTLSAVGLLAASGGRAALSAAFRYLLFAMAGSLAYLTGVVLLYGAESELDAGLLGAGLRPGLPAFTALSFMTVGLCLKSALFPFHAWLPPAYASAAAPVSVLLSAVVAKSALYVLLRLWIDVFPAVSPHGPSQLLGALGGLAIAWGSILAFRQRRLSMLLAYSSIAQIGYFFLLFPLGSETAVEGGLYLILSHAAAKGAMFMAAGTIRRTIGHDDLERMRGLAHRLPFTFFTLALAGVSLMGMPPSGGFIGKYLLARAAFELGQWWWGAIALTGGLLAAAYVFRVLRSAFVPLAEGEPPGQPPNTAEVVSLVLAALSAMVGVVPDVPLSLVVLEGAR